MNLRPPEGNVFLFEEGAGMTAREGRGGGVVAVKSCEMTVGVKESHFNS